LYRHPLVDLNNINVPGQRIYEVFTPVAQTLDVRPSVRPSVRFLQFAKILHLLLLTSVTSSTVERANSSLRFIKNSFRSTMGSFLEHMLANWKTYSYIYTIVSRSFQTSQLESGLNNIIRLQSYLKLFKSQNE
jgi:hypothetical protein